MPGKLMTQAELMAWEQKSRRWVFLGLIGLVTGIFGFGLLTLDVSYRMLKKTPVMAEALVRISADPRVQKALGTPLRTGWKVTGELEDLPDQGSARLEFSLQGPEGRAAVKLRAEKSPTGTWRYLLLEIKPTASEAISCADG
jgi:Cytochrome oxidase complex assembly protein 1